MAQSSNFSTFINHWSRVHCFLQFPVVRPSLTSTITSNTASHVFNHTLFSNVFDCFPLTVVIRTRPYIKIGHIITTRNQIFDLLEKLLGILLADKMIFFKSRLPVHLSLWTRHFWRSVSRLGFWTPPIFQISTFFCSRPLPLLYLYFFPN